MIETVIRFPHLEDVRFGIECETDHVVPVIKRRAYWEDPAREVGFGVTELVSMERYESTTDEEWEFQTKLMYRRLLKHVATSAADRTAFETGTAREEKR